MGPVRRSESIIDVNLSKPGQSFTKLWIVFGFSLMKPQILKEQQFSFFHLRNHFLNFTADGFRSQTNVFLQKQRKFFSRRLQTHAFHPLPFGASKMRHQNAFSSRFDDSPDRWKSSHDSGIVGDLLIFIQGYIEINPDQYPPSL